MPRRKRRPKARSTVTSGMLLQLRCGWDYFGDGFGGFKTGRDLDYERAQRVWREYKDVVIEAATKRHGPGHRAWAWWAFDAPERRNEEVAEVAQLAKMGLLTDEEKTLLREEFIRKKDLAEQEYSNAEWPVAIGQALEIVGRLSPSEIEALRTHEHESEEDWDDDE